MENFLFGLHSSSSSQWNQCPSLRAGFRLNTNQVRGWERVGEGRSRVLEDELHVLSTTSLVLFLTYFFHIDVDALFS